jgi:hypothetical protein
MGYQNGKITYPVNQYDCQQALGTSKYDWGELCKHKSINPWARFKPVKMNSVEHLTNQIRATLHYGLDCICGNWNTFAQNLGAYIGLTYGSSQQATINGRIAQRGDWENGVCIIRPEGGFDTGSPYRISDFGCAENVNLGYLKQAQMLYHMPNYAQDFPDVGVIGSEINGLIDYSTGRPSIDINQLQSAQILPDESSVYDFILPVSIEGKTHPDYNSVSVLELMKMFMEGSAFQRGVVLVDTSGFVSEFRTRNSNGEELGYIPWGQWAGSQDECTLFGQWVCCEYYASYNGSYYVLIPGFEYQVFFEYGSGPGQQELAFAKDPAIGVCLEQHNYYMFISFYQLTNENLANYDVYVSLIRMDNGVESYIETRQPLSTYTVVTSGNTFYQKYINVDYDQQSFPGDVFKVRIDYKQSGTSQSEKTYWLTNIVLTT